MIFADKNTIKIIKGKDTLIVSKDDGQQIFLQIERTATEQTEKKESNILLSKNEQAILKSFLEK